MPFVHWLRVRLGRLEWSNHDPMKLGARIITHKLHGNYIMDGGNRIKEISTYPLH